ncbi:hypothetical protein [Streptomyces sp. NPDC058745]|uniref:hypothetical protein n=1 Tax=Streptomyces sp. NPDC058745 TaxID=3346621 RepID=UPI0036B0D124
MAQAIKLDPEGSLARHTRTLITRRGGLSGGNLAEEGAASVAAAERVQTLLRDWAKNELLTMRVLQTERKAVSLGD